MPYANIYTLTWSKYNVGDGEVNVYHVHQPSLLISTNGM